MEDNKRFFVKDVRAKLLLTLNDLIIVLLFITAGYHINTLYPIRKIAENFSGIWQSFTQKLLTYFSVIDIISTIIIILGVIVLFVLHKRKLKKYKRLIKRKIDFRLWQTNDMWDTPQAIILGLILGVCLNELKPFNTISVSITSGFFALIILALLLMGLEALCANPISEDYVYFERNKKLVLAKTTVMGIALFGLPVWIPNFWGFTLPRFFESADLLGYYIALLSLTFISISVMSVLSDRSVIIYWENVSENKLIKPIFGSFAAYTYYSVGAAIGAGISIALGNGTAFIIFGALNIITMVLLTYTMIDVYFDRESKKVKLEAEFKIDSEDYFWVSTGQLFKGGLDKETYYVKDAITGEKYTQEDKENKEIGYERFMNKIILLNQNIYRARDEHDLTYLKEVYDLYIKNISLFYFPEGKAITTALFAEINEQTWPLVKKSLKNFTEDLIYEDKYTGEVYFKHQTGLNRSVNNYWSAFAGEDEDAPIWEALANSSYFKAWLEALKYCKSIDRIELIDFVKLIVQRIIVDYNLSAEVSSFIRNRNISDTEEKIEYGLIKMTCKEFDINFEALKGGEMNIKQIEDFFNKERSDIVLHSASAFRVTLHLIYTILTTVEKDLQGVMLTTFADFPLFKLFTPYLKDFDFNEAEIEFWKECFICE